MTETVEPRPEFRLLPEAAIVAALQDPEPANPIAIEVARLILAYTTNFQRHVKSLGHIPSEILHRKARWPIEEVAMRLTTEVIRETLASPAPPEQV